jgi:hypothetical protein
VLQPVVTAPYMAANVVNLHLQGRKKEHFWLHSLLLPLPAPAWHAAPSWIPAHPAAHGRRHLGDSASARQASYVCHRLIGFQSLC